MTREEAEDVRQLVEYLDHDWMAPRARLAYLRLREAARAVLSEPPPPEPQPSPGDSRP